MARRLLLLMAMVVASNANLGCTNSGQETCPRGNDGGGGDLGTGAEVLRCRSDDPYHFEISMHMSADRTIVIRSLETRLGSLGGGNYGEMIGRLLAENGTVLNEYRDIDPMLCSGKNCSPLPHEVDFWSGIRMAAGAAFYELTDTVSGKPPIRFDLRGHVQLLCMNALCELDVCKPLSVDAESADLSDREGGTVRDAEVE